MCFFKRQNMLFEYVDNVPPYMVVIFQLFTPFLSPCTFSCLVLSLHPSHTVNVLLSCSPCISISVLSLRVHVCVCVSSILLGFSLLMISSHPQRSRLNYSVALRALFGAD